MKIYNLRTGQWPTGIHVINVIDCIQHISVSLTRTSYVLFDILYIYIYIYIYIYMYIYIYIYIYIYYIHVNLKLLSKMSGTGQQTSSRVGSVQ